MRKRATCRTTREIAALLLLLTALRTVSAVVGVLMLADRFTEQKDYFAEPLVIYRIMLRRVVCD